MTTYEIHASWGDSYVFHADRVSWWRKLCMSCARCCPPAATHIAPLPSGYWLVFRSLSAITSWNTQHSSLLEINSHSLSEIPYLDV